MGFFPHFPALSCTPHSVPNGRCAVGVILEGTPTATEIANHLIIITLPETIAVGIPPYLDTYRSRVGGRRGKKAAEQRVRRRDAARAWGDEGSAKRGGAGTEGGGVKCNVLILSWLHKRGVSKTDTPLLRNRLYFNILHFTLEIGSGAGTTKSDQKSIWFQRV